MTLYKMIVSYDGTHYYGWQLQSAFPSTITQCLQDTFYKVFHERISIVGASRTDAGVHARGQVAAFKASLVINLRDMCYAWNNVLPPDIKIEHIEYPQMGFHPFYNVVAKTYHYHIFTHRPHPFLEKYGLYCRLRIDINKLEHALQLFVGTHDFTAFSSADSPVNNRIRTIKTIELSYNSVWNCYQVVVVGERFLRHMVRRIVGAALKVAITSDLSIHFISQTLKHGKVSSLLPTAPAKGLTLHSIVYKGEESV